MCIPPAAASTVHFGIASSFKATATTEVYTLSLHDALPILLIGQPFGLVSLIGRAQQRDRRPTLLLREERSEEHTSELQSPYDLVCRLLLEKKKAETQCCYVRYTRQISPGSERVCKGCCLFR